MKFMLGFGDMHKGMIRNTNQDYIYFVNREIGSLDNLYVVADGIGGHNAGEVASKSAVVFFREYLIDSANSENYDTTNLLVSALNYANNKVYDMGMSIAEFRDMGTTFTAVTVQNNNLIAVHIGDSRLYLIRDKKIEQITTDHTYAMDLLKAGILSEEEAKVSREAHMLTRAIGGSLDIKIDVILNELREEDIFILCSDGLSNMVEDEDIMKIAYEKSISLEDRTEKLINLANKNGGKDNIAIILVEVSETHTEHKNSENVQEKL